MNLGLLKSVFKFIGIFGFAIIYVPIIAVLIGSVINFLPESEIYQFTIEGYVKIFANSELLNALWNSIQVALITSFISTLMGVGLSYSLQNSNKKYLLQLRKIFYLPMLLPEIVIGISLLIWFVMIHLSLGKFSLIVSHVTFALPYTVILVTLGLEGIDESLIEAAKDLGANQVQTFYKLTLPMLKPSLLGIFLLSFVISFDDLLISYFTAGAGNDTLPMKLYSLMRFGLSNELKAISSIILGASVLISGVLIKLLFRTHNTKSEFDSQFQVKSHYRDC
jgi:spermidine/putrescine transport system permease protein